ncbi:hypothetical protein AAC387_Pa04g2301 [Persea americana]
MCCRDCPLSRNGSRNLHYNHLLLVQLMTMMMTTMGVVGSPRLKGGSKDRDENVKVVEEEDKEKKKDDEIQEKGTEIEKGGKGSEVRVEIKSCGSIGS